MLWDGRYLLEEGLGGGFCTAHRARDQATGEQVILKILREENLHSGTAFGEWMSDARTRAQHESVYLPRVLLVKHAPRPYSVSELLPGPTLAHLRDLTDANWATLIPALQAMAQSLTAAGIAPSDLDPTNILFKDGDLSAPAYIDCGRVGDPSDLHALLYAGLTGYDAVGPWRERWGELGYALPEPKPVVFFRPDLPLASAALLQTAAPGPAVRRLGPHATTSRIAALRSRGADVWRLTPVATGACAGFMHASRLPLPLDAYRLSGEPLLIIAHDAEGADKPTRQLLDRAKNAGTNVTVEEVSSTATDLAV